MRKIFCDRQHNAECTSRIGRLHLSVTHQTGKGEVVSEDEYRPMDLCGDCIDEFLATFLVGQSPLPMVKAMAMVADTATPEMPGWRDGPVHDEPVTGQYISPVETGEPFRSEAENDWNSSRE
jgi:hypothetical protein